MDNRQRLLNCALDLFSRRGYDAVGVREVAESACVTKPTLYHYFDSKRGLLEDLLQREAEPLLSDLMNAAAYHGDMVLTLEAIAETYFDFAQRSSAFYRLQLTLYFAPPESEGNKAIQPYTRKQSEILEEVFLKAEKDHGNFRGRQSRYAAGFLGVINAAIGMYVNGQIDLSAEVIYQTVHQFMHGIFS